MESEPNRRVVGENAREKDRERRYHHERLEQQDRWYASIKEPKESLLYAAISKCRPDVVKDYIYGHKYLGSIDSTRPTQSILRSDLFRYLVEAVAKAASEVAKKGGTPTPALEVVKIFCDFIGTYDGRFLLSCIGT